MSVEIKPGFGREELPSQLVANSLLIGAEIGVDRGEHAEALLKAGVVNLFLVDLWQQQKAGYFDIANKDDAVQASNMRETLARMNKWHWAVQFLVGRSEEMADLVDDETLDFVYIDANHNLESVRKDLEKWVPKVRSGGWITGHDFLDSENCCGSAFGVKTAVLECCERLGVTELFVCQNEPFPNFHFVKP